MNFEQERADFAAWYASQDTDMREDLCVWSAQTGFLAALQSQKPEPNNLMLSAVIRMPFDMAMADHVSRMQFYQRAQQALDELEALQSQDREDVLVQAIQEAIALLGPEAPSCSGCEYEWNHALRALRAAIDHARRIEGEP